MYTMLDVDYVVPSLMVFLSIFLEVVVTLIEPPLLLGRVLK